MLSRNCRLNDLFISSEDMYTKLHQNAGKLTHRRVHMVLVNCCYVKIKMSVY